MTGAPSATTAEVAAGASQPSGACDRRAAALTVVTYHYVGPIARSRYPAIKGVELDGFREQLTYICRHYAPVSMRQVVDAVSGESELPRNAVLLTFDDGYAGHYAHAFPDLFDRRLPAAFFPVAGAVVERRVLDVNKVHFVLACQPDRGMLVAHIDAAVDGARREFDLASLAAYRQRHWRASTFDPPEVIYIKRMLQHALPAALRGRIAGDLFRRWVTADERAFADELYLSVAQLRHMSESGMDVGGHSYEHRWMNTLSPIEQAAEVDRSIDFLRHVGVDVSRFAYAYPFGGYNDDSMRILAQRGCAVAFTTATDVARIHRHTALALPRLRTNDLPSEADALPGIWTRRANV